VAELAAAPLQGFVDAHVDVPFLLVALEDAQGELEAGLTACAKRPRVDSPALKSLGFDTHQIDGSELKRLAALVEGERDAVGRNIHALRRRIARGRHFAIPLIKREGANDAFASRVSVGRAGNVDVVLRHISVSKFHAWFERDAHGALRVADADTTNGTQVNELRATPREPIAVIPGDLLRFGLVEAMLCDAEALWHALQAR
jgi:hypothetical protein